jgi:hypothetical protein
MARMPTPRTILRRYKISDLPRRVTQPEGTTGTRCFEGDVRVTGFSDFLAATQDRPRAEVDHPLFHIFVVSVLS